QKTRHCALCLLSDPRRLRSAKINPVATKKKSHGKKPYIPKSVTRSCQLPGEAATPPRLANTSSVHLYKNEAAKTSRIASDPLFRGILVWLSRAWIRYGQRRQKPVTAPGDRKSTRLNSSHGSISYAVFCLKKKTTRLQE